jgi:prepilin-type N-terminal cleavage/methylation domain-containing protein
MKIRRSGMVQKPRSILARIPSPHVSRRGASGFTITELMVAIVIGTILIGSIYQVLITNQRIAVVQREQVLGQQTVRAGIDLLVQELRELSPGGGDLSTIAASEVAFRGLRAFGVSCQVVNSVPPVVTVANEGRPFAVGDSVYLFADGNPAVAIDDEWMSVAVTQVTNGLTCGTDAVPAQQLALSGPGTQQDSDRVLSGAIVRGWDGVSYSLKTVNDVVYLSREQGGVSSRLVGPLRAGNGLAFRYLTADGAVTTVPADVARIEITLRTLSQATNRDGNHVTDSLITSVNLRN